MADEWVATDAGAGAGAGAVPTAEPPPPLPARRAAPPPAPVARPVPLPKTAAGPVDVRLPGGLAPSAAAAPATAVPAFAAAAPAAASAAGRAGQPSSRAFSAAELARDAGRERQWAAKLAGAVQFRRDYGRWPTQGLDPHNLLGKWCTMQKELKRAPEAMRTPRARARIARLDAAGFDWGGIREGTREEQWEAKFAQLKEFHEAHGRWPRDGDGDLGLWCARQRLARLITLGLRRGTRRITPAHEARLAGIGFEWAPPTAAEERWNAGFAAATQFKADHGRWPKPAEGLAGKWCTKQWQAKEGKGGRSITPEHLARLEAAGFDWDQVRPTTREEEWAASLAAATQFKADHGRWPSKQEPHGTWCHNQRSARKYNNLAPSRVELLDKAGFEWTVVPSWDQRWNASFAAAVQFKADNGRWPKLTDGALGAWAFRQRQAKAGKGDTVLTTDRMERLDDAGFEWTTPARAPRRRKSPAQAPAPAPAPAPAALSAPNAPPPPPPPAPPPPAPAPSAVFRDGKLIWGGPAPQPPSVPPRFEWLKLVGRCVERLAKRVDAEMNTPGATQGVWRRLFGDVLLGALSVDTFLGLVLPLVGLHCGSTTAQRLMGIREQFEHELRQWQAAPGGGDGVASDSGLIAGPPALKRGAPAGGPPPPKRAAVDPAAAGAAEDLSLMQKFQIAARRVGLSLPPGQTFVASVQQAMAETGLESSGGNLTRDVELLYNTFKL